VCGVSGVTRCIFSLGLARQTFIIPHSASDVRELAGAPGTLRSAVVGVIVLAALFSRYLPAMRLFNAMILTPPGTEGAHADEPRLRPELGASGSLLNPLLERDQSLIGRQGTAMTVLRPAGKAQIGDEFLAV